MELSSLPSWQAIAFRGALGVLFGLGAFLWPSVTLTALVLLFGVYALVDGIAAIAVGAHLRTGDRGWEGWRGWLVPLEGLLGVAIGLGAIVWTGAATLAVTIFVGAWALLTGALEVAAGLRLRRDVPGEAFLLFGGAASIVLGLLLLAFPHAGSLLLVVMLGSYALVFGAALLMLAMQIRRREEPPHAPVGDA